MISVLTKLSNNSLMWQLRYRILIFLVRFMKPWGIQVESTTFCNLRCVFCERSSSNRKNSSLDLEKFVAFIKPQDFLKFPGFGFSVDLTRTGEPLLNENLLRMVHHVKQGGGRCGFTSNFLLADKRKAKELLDSGLDYIGISLDAADRHLYETVRRGAQFHRLVENISTFVSQRNELHKKSPSLSIMCTVSNDNIVSEMPKVVKLASDLGITKIRFQTAARVDGEPYNPNSLENFQNYFRDALQIARNNGISLETSALVNKRRCCIPFYPFVTVEGYILPCCWITQMMSHGDQITLSFGNVFQEDLLNIWFSDAYINFRKRVLSGNFPSICLNCPVVDIPKDGNDAGG